MTQAQLTPSATAADYIRQSGNLILAPAMWGLSSLGFISDTARTAGEFSDMSDNLLVPLGPAFSIWFPIFVGCIAYGILQALPRHRQNPLFRSIGWWTAAGFLFICGWALITAYAPDAVVQWGTALIFIPAVAALIIATIRLNDPNVTFSRVDKWLVLVPISLIAGWCSLAVFLNWTPIAYDVFANGTANVTSSLLMLVAALGMIIGANRLAGGNRIYLIPPAWGLAWLVTRHLAQDAGTPVIGWVALAGLMLLLSVALTPSKQSDKRSA